MTVNKVNRERVQLLVGALRSGEFAQDMGKLRTNNGYCCLGVACEIHRRYAEDAGEWKKDGGWWVYMGQDATMPPSVWSWFGFGFHNPVLSSYNMAGMNDTGASFQEIADAIEKKYLK